MSAGVVIDAAVVVLSPLESPISSLLDLTLTVAACLFGGGDIDLSFDDWNASYFLRFRDSSAGFMMRD